MQRLIYDGGRALVGALTVGAAPEIKRPASVNASVLADPDNLNSTSNGPETYMVICSSVIETEAPSERLGRRHRKQQCCAVWMSGRTSNAKGSQGLSSLPPPRAAPSSPPAPASTEASPVPSNLCS